MYIEKEKNKYKNYDKKLYDSIGTIVNKIGINHPITEKALENLTETEKIEWYDKCFKMMIHLLRYEEINNIKKERNNLIKLIGDNNEE